MRPATKTAKLTARQAQQALSRLADAAGAPAKAKYFQASQDGYADGDRFRGVTVPNIRAVAKAFGDLEFGALSTLLKSEWHEDRFLAVTILANRAKKAKGDALLTVFGFYVEHLRHVNHWDLIDMSAPYVLGPLLPGPAEAVVSKLARSGNVWERRIAVLAHQWNVRKGRVDAFLKAAVLMLDDPHDLIHKAVGWLLRETGEADEARLTSFLDTHAAAMPRTMLRSAIQKLPPSDKKRYMAKGAGQSRVEPRRKNT